MQARGKGWQEIGNQRLWEFTPSDSGDFSCIDLYGMEVMPEGEMHERKKGRNCVCRF
jgi:hypothetical protein